MTVIIWAENIHRVFLCDMISFIMSHEDEILDVSFGADIKPVIIVTMKDTGVKQYEYHAFQLKAELYVRHQFLWGNKPPIENPIRGQLWTDMLFTRIACPNVKLTHHPLFSETSIAVKQLPYFIKRTQQVSGKFQIVDSVYSTLTVFEALDNLLITGQDMNVVDRILSCMWDNNVHTYLDPLFDTVDTRPRRLQMITGNGSMQIIYGNLKDPIPVIDAMYSLDGSLIPVDTGGERLRKLIDDCIDKTENMETRMFLLRWKKEHYGFDERKGVLRL